MSVYTTVTEDTLAQWLRHYDIGQLINLQGIAAGVTNTNYFVTTSHGCYVLTLFETLRFDQLPFYLNFMDHVAQRQVACPAPIANRAQQFTTPLANKPACLVTCLDGKEARYPSTKLCFAVGHMLANLHVAGADYPYRMKNQRGPRWWNTAFHQLLPYLAPAEQESLKQEIAFHQGYRMAQLPSGIIHADLFKDNVLVMEERVSGFIDFYYACDGPFIYDVAIAVNDWARNDNDTFEASRASAFLEGYQSVRPLTSREKHAWPRMLRAAALRFWTSRLLDFYQRPSGALVQTKDPSQFQRIIESHRSREDFWL